MTTIMVLWIGHGSATKENRVLKLSFPQKKKKKKNLDKQN